MGKTKIKKTIEPVHSEHENAEEQRQLNHWSYSDDPLLNIDPVFSDEPTPAPVAELTAEFKTQEFNPEASTSSVPKSSPKNDSVLGSIINNAKLKSETLQNEVLENDPVIAKLAKIEELMRTGGASSEDLYTDTSKSDGRSAYAKRAEEFHRQNLQKLNPETELERKLRLQAEAQKKRDELKGDVSYESKPEEQSVTQTFSFEATKQPYLATRKQHANNELDRLENEIKEFIQEIKIIKQNKIEKEALASIMEIENKEFENEMDRKAFLEKRLDQLRIFKKRMELKLKTKSLPGSNVSLEEKPKKSIADKNSHSKTKAKNKKG